MENKDKIILDLCGGTGAWSAPYKEAGYDVRLITLPDNDVRLFRYPEYQAYGVLAAPPCTEFSYSKHFHGKGNYKHDFAAGLAIADACKRIISIVKPVFHVLENPRGYLRDFYGPADYSFDPWWFGDLYQKRTDLWGEFNIPERTVFEKPNNTVKFSMLKSKEIHPEYYGILDRQTRRAITPPGFAKAFFEANK